jgi:hypothetical protein
MTAQHYSPSAHPCAADDPPPRRPPTDKTPLEATNPGAGRTTRQGRLTESPASLRSAGPSGQRGQTKHQKRHTNK